MSRVTPARFTVAACWLPSVCPQFSLRETAAKVMGDGEEEQAGHAADGVLAPLGGVMADIHDGKAGRVVENKRGALKADAVFGQICDGLGSIPLELHI